MDVGLRYPPPATVQVALAPHVFLHNGAEEANKYRTYQVHIFHSLNDEKKLMRNWFFFIKKKKKTVDARNHISNETLSYRL